jgi:hypothetical protein
LNRIFRTDPNGISKSATETRCDNSDNTGGGVGGTAGTLVGGVNCVPYFNVGR